MTIHLAGEPIGMVQRCVRCGEVLIDRATERVIATTGLAPRWWTGSVYVGDGEEGETTDPPTCALPAR